jgi:MFS transporter, DHA2 family, multidrug resistance protein
MNATMTNLTGYDQLILAQVVRALGMPLVIVPLTTLATGHIGPQQSGSASALYNMFRNLGGSIGIALLATQLDVREKFHSVRLGEAINAFNPATGERLETLARQFVARGADALSAGQQALGAVAGVVRREAYVMAYGDCFYLIGAVLVTMVLLVWLCRKTKGEATEAGCERDSDHSSSAVKPACSKGLSLVSAARMSSSSITTQEMQSVSGQSLSRR